MLGHISFCSREMLYSVYMGLGSSQFSSMSLQMSNIPSLAALNRFPVDTFDQTKLKEST